MSGLINNKRSIPLAFITDNNYVVPTMVAILSAERNKRATTSYTYYVVCHNLNNSDLFDLLKKQGIDIHLIEYNKNYAFDIKQNTYVITSALIKFDLANIFTDYDKILYLDGDILILNDLTDLYNQNIDDCFVGAVTDIYVCTKTDYSQKLHIDNRSYFNSGVMLLNLKRQRENAITEKLIRTKQKLVGFKYMDQDAFNVVFDKSTRLINIKYNFCSSFVSVKHLWAIKRFFRVSIWQVLKESFPVILHYTGKKPWKNNIPLSRLWLEYFKQIDFPQDVYSKLPVYRLNFRGLVHSAIFSIWRKLWKK